MIFKNKKNNKINKYISTKSIIENLSAKNKEDVIKILCKKAGEILGYKYEDEILKDVFYRESLVSTGIEKNIAIPHAKLNFIKESLIIFAKHSTGIDWNSIDGEPAKLIFLVLTPKDQDDIQLKIYSYLLNNLKNEGIRTNLLNAKTKDELLKILSTQPTN